MNALLLGVLLAAAPLQEAEAPPMVQVGLERIEAESGGVLKGRKIALLAHGASVTAAGRHAVDVLRGVEGLEIVRLFAPEHGARGMAAAGAKIESGRDEEWGLPVVSLYGEKTQPEAGDFEGVDTLVIDLQDAGVRFYTYASTALLAVEAAAQAGVRVVVLDRPNPLGGERIEGPLAEPSSVMPRTLVNTTPGPLVHGLTLGEMVRLYNDSLPRKTRVDVVEMRGWRRSMTWHDTGREWVPPSPSLRSADAAIAYPGTCLLEATNVSEGRGTEAPFLTIGAPWLRVPHVLAGVAVQGFALGPARFTPKASPAAPSPKHKDQDSAGIAIRVVDPVAARPWELGVALLQALRRQPEFEWTRQGRGLDALLGTRRVREMLRLDWSLNEILDADQGAHAGWRAERKKHLIYE